MNPFKFVASICIFAMLVLIAPPVTPPVHAQSVSSLDLIAESAFGYTTNTAGVAFILVARGTTYASHTRTVAAGGDITLKVGDYSSEVADATVKCPSGGSAGVIDVSDAACNTVGEVVDVINASPNWLAIPIDALRGDSSNDTFLVSAESPVNATYGLPVWRDTAVALDLTLSLLPDARVTSNGYPDPARWLVGTPGNKKLAADPFGGTRTKFIYGNENTTYGSGTSLISIISVRDTFDPNTGKWTQTSNTLLSNIAAGATTVTGTLDFSHLGVVSGKGERLLFRVTNSDALSSPSGQVYGLMYPYKTPVQ